jgi:hypothetical protein
MTVSRRLRFEILRRDGHACRYCGAKAPDVELTIDHVKPVALGGTDVPENLVTACRACNAGKTSVPADSPTVADVAADALRWKLAIEEVVRWRALDMAVLADQVTRFDADWRAWTSTFDDKPFPRDTNWPDSVERFLELGLTIDILRHYIGVAMRNQRLGYHDRWAYFCGCCWREIDRLHEDATQVAKTNEQIERRHDA